MNRPYILLFTLYSVYIHNIVHVYSLDIIIMYFCISLSSTHDEINLWFKSDTTIPILPLFSYYVYNK